MSGVRSSVPRATCCSSATCGAGNELAIVSSFLSPIAVMPTACTAALSVHFRGPYQPFQGDVGAEGRSRAPGRANEKGRVIIASGGRQRGYPQLRTSRPARSFDFATRYPATVLANNGTRPKVLASIWRQTATGSDRPRAANLLSIRVGRTEYYGTQRSSLSYAPRDLRRRGVRYGQPEPPWTAARSACRTTEPSRRDHCDSLGSGQEAAHGSSLQRSGRSTRQRSRHGAFASASELVSRSTLAP